jgi:manganese-dependent inorganic pyrophosphatase
MSRIYVTGHRNPDTDSIASAMGYAELRRRLDPNNEYVPVRLGDLNAQTRWVLERSGADEPDFMGHVYLRVRDVMREEFPVAGHRQPVREVGLEMTREHVDLVPIVDDDGALVGVMTERALARRYIRESRQVSSLVETPTAIGAVVRVLEGRLVAGEEDREIAGRVWVQAMEVGTYDTGIAAGDVVVVGNRADAQQLAIDLGAALLVTTNDSVPSDEILERAREGGTAVVVSPLDTYVSSRMITLAAPSSGLMDRQPLSVSTEALVSDISDQIKDVDYRAAVAVDSKRRPVGLVTRSDLVSPKQRKVLLVDHAEQAQSVPGIEQAEIVEILDHHHIGSVETRVPVRATFDPVGSTATLVIERFRQNGMEPSHSSATLLLGAILSDTVILNSPTTTERDRTAVDYLARVLALDAIQFGREMFETTSDVSGVPAAEIVSRDAKEYEVAHDQTISIAQVETVGNGLLERKDELLDAMREVQERKGYLFSALMVTDILAKGTDLLIAGDTSQIERTFDKTAEGGVIQLPGVMSRKKQVVPKLMAAS